MSSYCTGLSHTAGRFTATCAEDSKRPEPFQYASWALEGQKAPCVAPCSNRVGTVGMASPVKIG